MYRMNQFKLCGGGMQDVENIIKNNSILKNICIMLIRVQYCPIISMD